MIFILGVLCLLYYLAICFTLKKWDSTFARVWLLLGIVLTVAGYCAGKGIYGQLLKAVVLIPVVVCCITIVIILKGMNTAREEGLVIIVLGAQVNGRRVTDSLRRRLDKAYEYLVSHESACVIVSGGQGRGEEITEAEAMESYLLNRGIAADRIVREEKSTTTKENLQFSAAYIQDLTQPIGIVSNNFHLYRACLYARQQGYKKPFPLPAGCHPILLPNYLLRECFAVWKVWMKF